MENEGTLDIGFLVLLGSLGMLILAFGIILFVMLYQKKVLAQQNQMQVVENRHQKDLLNATIQVAEIEREKIARNIHDDVGTTLNVIKLHLTKISRNPADGALSEKLITESMGLLDDSIQNIRNIAKDLMPPTLIKLGFEKGISELCRQIDASGTIRIRLDCSLDGIRLPSKTELQLYRIMQEVINNIIKHSRAQTIRISIRPANGGVGIGIFHDGEGISSDMLPQLTAADRGIGLKSIQSRVQLINASIHYATAANNESEISIEVPFAAHEKNN